MPASPEVTAILVGTHERPDVLARLIASLAEQSLPPTQILCVDQSPDGRFAPLARTTELAVEVIAHGENLGYPSACNRGAARASGEYLLFINPDAEADAAASRHWRPPWRERPDAAIAGAQVLLRDGRSVNAGDNVLHLTGLSWAGRYGLPRRGRPARPAAVVSGAALMVRRSAFEALGGFTDGFFMYYDDVDLAWRARLAGWEVLFCPGARVVHDYEFEKGSYKWRYLERNRWWCLLAHLRVRNAARARTAAPRGRGRHLCPRGRRGLAGRQARRLEAAVAGPAPPGRPAPRDPAPAHDRRPPDHRAHERDRRLSVHRLGRRQTAGTGAAGLSAGSSSGWRPADRCRGIRR